MPAELAGYRHVVAGVIRSASGEILIARRPDHVPHGGLWEFPGGKVEAGEGAFEALQRELAEELDITVRSARPLIRIPHRYPDGDVLLDVWEVECFTGHPRGCEGQALSWSCPEQLETFAFPGANLPILTAISLPPLYLITPEPGDRSLWPDFLHRLGNRLAAGIRLVQFRSKDLSASKFRELAGRVAVLCADYGARLLINGDWKQAEAAGADGYHLPSRRLMAMGALPEVSLMSAASCHTREEIEKASRLGVDFVVLSPVNTTLSHAGAPTLGWQRFAQLAAYSRVPVFALGGVQPADLATARGRGAQGIAAITGIWDFE